MHLELIRLSTTGENTIGALYIDGLWQCWTLEDTQRFEKIAGQTRILSGTYPIHLRTGSPMSDRYAERYPTEHRGMLWLQGVPGFTYVYIHPGNDEDDTDGCLLVGEEVQMGARTVGPSIPAYRRIYRPIADAVEGGESVQITIRDFG